ncbi:MAG: T9SS type A sorting domain-containing protein [Chlorobiales bacterium]|nr:T9SS type A sorting domain-containing protein [Chlorobiales bacterium]
MQSLITSGTGETGTTKPLEFALGQNYPNPFNPVTTIQYTIPSTAEVKLKVFDLLGREIRTLVNERKPSGSYEVRFDGASLASGMYFYRLMAGNYVKTKKMVLVK